MRGNYSSQFKRNRRKFQITIWIMLLILLFLLFGFIVAWALNPNSTDVIRGILGIEPTSTPTPIPTSTPTPSPTPSPSPTPTPTLGRIVIDPGRGGEEKIPITTTDGSISEKTINLEISLMIKELLEDRGYTVIMTRTEDIAMEQIDRAALANSSEADLFISIHMNNLASDKTVNGLEILYGKDREDSKELADTLITPIISACGMKNRGVKSSSSYTVLSNIEVPSVLIQLGFISNDTEVANLTKYTYRDTLVRSICDGIDKYMEKHRKEQQNQ